MSKKKISLIPWLLLLGIALVIGLGAYYNYKYCCGSCHKPKHHLGAHHKGKHGHHHKGGHHGHPHPHPPHKNGLKPHQHEMVNVNSGISTQKVDIPKFSMKTPDGKTIETDSNIGFAKNDFHIKEPVDGAMKNIASQIGGYLKQHENKELELKGFYSPEESYNGSFPNLGYARANAIKNFMINNGIPSNLFELSGDEKANLIAKDGNVYGPFEIQVIDKPDAEKEKQALEAMRKEIIEHPINLRFKTGETQIQLNDSQRKEFAQIAKYLDKNTQASCIVLGHTDNTGSEETNKLISKQRADFVKNYMVDNGINADKIHTEGRWSLDPIADNSTEEGRAKNRRTSITLTK